MSISSSKTEYMYVHRKDCGKRVKFYDTNLEKVDKFNYLRLTIS